jgi:SAM-dependent methyltransferase
MSLLGKIADKKRLELILKEIAYSKSQLKVLDLGCGDGWLVKKLECDCDIIGVDNNLKKETKNLLRISAYDLPFQSNYFDYVIAVEIIEHLEPKVYKEIKRILKQDGMLIVTSPKPRWNWLIKVLSGIGLSDPLITKHINPVYPDDLPFKLLKKQSLLFIEWFGVFKNEN